MGTREVELKLKVDGEQALRAIVQAARGKAEPEVRQVNHFFDTADRRLHAGLFVLRLRDEAGRWFLTAKGPQQQSKSGALTSKDEVETEIGQEEAAAILAGKASALSMLERATISREAPALMSALKDSVGARALAEIGSFENRRTRVAAKLPSGTGALEAVLELDRTTFPGPVVQCEVEMEIHGETDPAVAEAALRALLKVAAVEGRPASSKAKRFFAALEGKPI